MVNQINSILRRVPNWLFYVTGAAWAGYLFYLGVSGGLGVEPIEALEHRYGLLGLQLMVAGLLITPLRKWTGINLIKARRPIGVLAFFFVLAHLLVWAVLDVQSLDRVIADVIKRPYITIGMASFLMLLPLAITSNNWSVRKLGAAAWRNLHWFTYPAAVLGALHFVWLVKGFQIEPLAYMAGVLFLLSLRRKTLRPSWWPETWFNWTKAT